MKREPTDNAHTPQDHSITDHTGIVGVTPQPGRGALEIAFDPAKLSEEDVRKITLSHLQPDLSSPRKFALRLDGDACEAAAAKLERRVEAVPGVRRATATYIGRVLCLTFDPAVAPGEKVLEGVREAGANVRPLTPSEQRGNYLQQLLRGERNEEAACAIGLVGMILGKVLEINSGFSPATIIAYVAAYAFGGFYGLRSAISSLREKTLDIDLLMVLAALGAALVGEPFEGALLLFLFSFSNVLQRYAMDRTQRAIESLLTLRPATALLKKGDTTEQVSVESLVPGDVVLVRPGDHIPCDGTIAEGSGPVDESSLTGESLPVEKSAGNPVFAGTINGSGALDVRVTRGSEDSTLARMVNLVAEAQAEKSHTQRFLEKAEQYYAAGVIALTAMVLLMPWLAWGEEFDEAFLRAMTVMVVASPCALVISTPATVLSAIGGAARRGILIKGGSHLERAARVDIVAFDKTGTLTVGKPAVTEILHGDNVHQLSSATPDAREFLALCAAVESRSEHPLAAAVVTAAESVGMKKRVASAFGSTTGKGAEAEVDGRRILVGSERWLREAGAVGGGELAALAEKHQKQGKTCIWAAERVGGEIRMLGGFVLADTLRAEARDIAARLHALGVKKIVMLTGDQAPVAACIAGEAGVDEFRANLLPEDKVLAIRRLKQEGTVMMVGDGVNDAPALASSDLGVAMGAAGTDVAMETADVVLMGDRLENIPLMLGMARHAKRVLIQNLTFAGCVIVVLVAAALGLNLALPLGVVGHEGSTVLVCLNGLRLLVYKPR
jgi:Zn2+/Cd2+-exporting ATPase